jgi:hypothetical protein
MELKTTSIFYNLTGDVQIKSDIISNAAFKKILNQVIQSWLF